MPFFVCFSVFLKTARPFPLWLGPGIPWDFTASFPFVGGLAVVRQPLALCTFHVGKDRAERGILRAAGIDAEPNLPFGLVEVADPHLVEDRTILGAFDAEIILPAAEAIPHGFYADGDFRGCPV